VDLSDAQIVISEVMFRKQNGVAGLLAIRRSFPMLPFIVISEGDQHEAGTLLYAGRLRPAPTWPRSAREVELKPGQSKESRSNEPALYVIQDQFRVSA
jgi:hypothetical protein